MTTGRINQVTIAGRGPHRNPHRPPGGTERQRRTPPPLGLLRRGRRPTFTDSKRPVRARLAKPRTRITNRGAATGSQAGRQPLWTSRPPQGRHRDNVSTSRLHAKRCNPHLTDGRRGTRGKLPTHTRSGSARTAEQAGQCLSRNTVPHTAPRQDARQSNV